MTPAELKAAHPAIRGGKRNPLDTIRPMDSIEYREGCALLGISIYRSAKVLGISLASAKRYAAGSHPIPGTVAKLLRALCMLGRVEP